MQWTEDEKLDYLVRLPWKILPEEGDEPGDMVLTCAELPSAIGTGGSEREVVADFWASLRLTLRSYVRDGDIIPLPKGAAGTLPWETQVVEQWASRIRAVLTPKGETHADPEVPRLTAGDENAKFEALDREFVTAAAGR